MRQTRLADEPLSVEQSQATIGTDARADAATATPSARTALATAIIPARGGSQGLPGKNLARVGGAPLVARAVRAALRAERIGRVVVTTDDAEIAEGDRAGARCPSPQPGGWCAPPCVRAQADARRPRPFERGGVRDDRRGADAVGGAPRPTCGRQSTGVVCSSTCRR
ncbi:MAG TPA: hypothetical protein VFG92_03210 [Agromyces sp.]|nr:hypothetical protein [Agromyces sp.]